MTYTALLATTYYIVKSVLDPSIPPNAGLARPLRIAAPEGSILNCLAPAAVNGRLQLCQRVADMILGALAQAIPERVMACSNSACTVAYFIGKRPHDGSTWVYLESDRRRQRRARHQGRAGRRARPHHQHLEPAGRGLGDRIPLTLMRYELVADWAVSASIAAAWVCAVSTRRPMIAVCGSTLPASAGGAGLVRRRPRRARPGRSRAGRYLRRRFGRPEARPVVRCHHARCRRLRTARPAPSLQPRRAIWLRARSAAQRRKRSTACPLNHNSVIPTEAEPLDFARDRLREAQWRDLFCRFGDKTRSLDYAAPWAASLGMTGNSHMR